MSLAAVFFARAALTKNHTPRASTTEVCSLPVLDPEVPPQGVSGPPVPDLSPSSWGSLGLGQPYSKLHMASSRVSVSVSTFPPTFLFLIRSLFKIMLTCGIGIWNKRLENELNGSEKASESASLQGS